MQNVGPRRSAPLAGWRKAARAVAVCALTLLGASPVLAAPRPAGVLGAWIVEDGPPFPGVRMLRIENSPSGATGGAGLGSIAAIYDVWSAAPQNPAARSFQAPRHGAVLLRLSPL